LAIVLLLLDVWIGYLHLGVYDGLFQVPNCELKYTLTGNEYLWPILDDKVITILAKKGTKLRIGRIEE
jgi:hypothetical protein